MTYYTYNNPQTGDARWSKPAHPATNKTAFDCCGRTTPLPPPATARKAFMQSTCTTNQPAPPSPALAMQHLQRKLLL